MLDTTHFTYPLATYENVKVQLGMSTVQLPDILKRKDLQNENIFGTRRVFEAGSHEPVGCKARPSLVPLPRRAPTPGEARKPCQPPRRRQIKFQFNFLFRLVSNGLIKHCLNGFERTREQSKGEIEAKTSGKTTGKMNLETEVAKNGKRLVFGSGSTYA